MQDPNREYYGGLEVTASPIGGVPVQLTKDMAQKACENSGDLQRESAEMPERQITVKSVHRAVCDERCHSTEQPILI